MTDHRPYDMKWAAAPDGEPSEMHLSDPLQMEGGQMVRVMGDPFAPDIPHEYTAAVYGVMAAAGQHTFQVLTEYPERAGKWYEWMDTEVDFDVEPPMYGHLRQGDCLKEVRCGWILNPDPPPWPLPHVLLGTRTTDQSEADARIPPLLECPAAGRFVELAPLTGAVNLEEVVGSNGHIVDALRPHEPVHSHTPIIPALDWIIAAGDTGPEAECAVKWISAIRRQCERADVPCYVQHPDTDAPYCPEGLRVREMPEVQG